MVTIPLGVTDWESYHEDIPRLKVRNMYIVENPSSPDGMTRVSRPTLTTKKIIGVGPIKAMFRQDGCLNGDWFVVSGSELYRVNRTTLSHTKVGDLPGTGFCQFAGTSDRILVVRRDTLYSTDGASLTTVNLPDDIPGYEDTTPSVKSVATINGYFLLTITNTQRFYWIAPGEVDPDPLSFASAERLPDNIEAVATSSDEIWFIGSQGPEVWSPATDIDLPFQRINGRVYSDGTAYRDTVVQTVFNNLPCLVWVTTEGSVVIAQGGVKRISTDSVEEGIRRSSDFRAWSFRVNRHDFYILTSNNFTYVLDLTRGDWVRWDTYDKEYWLAHLGFQIGTAVYAGSSESNIIYLLEEGTDDDGLSVVREISGIVHNNGKPVQCASVAIKVNAGWSDSYDYEPKVELRWSDDQGVTWSEYDYIGLGTKGQYNTDTIFRSMGLIDRPSRVFEFRFAEKARFRIDYASMNEV